MARIAVIFATTSGQTARVAQHVEGGGLVVEPPRSCRGGCGAHAGGELEDRHAVAGLRPGGFGMLLVRKLVNEVLYSESGNEVLLIKHLI